MCLSLIRDFWLLNNLCKKLLPFCPYYFVLTILSNAILSNAIIGSASCAFCLAICPAALQPPSYMHLSQVGWTTVARSWRACLWLKLLVLIGFFAVPPVSMGAYRNMVLFRLICVTRYIGSQLLSASLIG